MTDQVETERVVQELLGSPAAVPTCPECHEPLGIGITVEVDAAGGLKEHLHELCFLRRAYVYQTQRIQTVSALLGAVVAKCGGSVVLHRSDVARALAAGGFQSRSEDPFVAIEAAVLQAPPGPALRPV